MNKTILDRTKENGYYLAPAIRNGTYEKEYGGGVCQVSSTLFNAVMMADLTITERHHHSWPMHYVPIGRDATIATGYKDFKFVNSTEGELVIFAHLDKKAKTVTVRLYGIHSTDFDHIRITSKRTGSLPAKGTKVKLDESLSAGSRVEERKERRGRTSVTYKEYYDADGKLIKKETAYEDSYPSIEGLVYVSADLYR
jgi:vancomycin resistance protein YoaR